MKVKLVFRLELGGDGGLVLLRTHARSDIHLPLVCVEGTLRFGTVDFDLAFDLRVEVADGGLWGTCRHAGVVYPVRFQPGPSPLEPKVPRPQTPGPPHPYEALEVAFEGADGSRRGGTLTWPTDRPVRGAAVLSTWYGRADRDQAVAGHRPFALWADGLARRGVASLRYDKRGVGGSQGDFDQATTADFAADLARALGFLRRWPGIRGLPVGLLGHSEGGHISAEVAAADPRVAFCVLLTPSGRPERELLAEEMFRAAQAVGGTPIRPQETVRLVMDLNEAARTAPSGQAAAERVRTLLTEVSREGRFPAERIEQRAAIAASPWMRHWLNYDHCESLKALACPTLAVFAGRDLQTSPRRHAANVRAALAGNPRARVIELAGLNHFLQTAITGAPSEYGAIRETIAPRALAAVCGWVEAVLRT